MYRKISIVLILTLIMTIFSFSACSNNDDSKTEVQKTVVNILTSSSYSEYGKAVGVEIENSIENIDVKVKSSGTGLANLKQFGNDKNRPDMVIAQSDVIDYIYNGKDFMEGEPVQTFSALAACYSEVCQLVVGQYSGIYSIADLSGKNVSVGESGSVVEFDARDILSGYALNMDDINVYNLGYGDSIEALKNGEIDAMFFISGVPERKMMEIAATNAVRLINISGVEAQSIMNAHQYYVPYVIPAGTYSGQEQDITTIAVKSVIVARNDLDEELVYNITRLIFENKDVIAESTVRDAESDIKFAVQGITIPFHSGAERYYKEMGAIK